MPCAKLKSSMVNGQPVRGLINFGTNVILKAIHVKALKFIFINLDRCFTRHFYSDLAGKPLLIHKCNVFQYIINLFKFELAP